MAMFIRYNFKKAIQEAPLDSFDQYCGHLRDILYLSSSFRTYDFLKGDSKIVEGIVADVLALLPENRRKRKIMKETVSSLLENLRASHDKMFGHDKRDIAFVTHSLASHMQEMVPYIAETILLLDDRKIFKKDLRHDL